MQLRLRLALAASLCLLPLLPLALRLARLQILEHRELSSRAAGAFDRNDEEIVARADIQDRGGRMLAESIPVWSCFVDMRMVADRQQLAFRLAPLVGQPAAEVLRKLRAAERIASVHSSLSYEAASVLASARLEGVGVTPRQDRLYPGEELARPLLGLVSSDGRGLAGIELAFEPRLAGKPRRLRVTRDGSGKTIYTSVERDAAAPDPLRLTIDRNIQFLAEAMLRQAAADYSMKRGMIAVQDPGNGEILAMAAYPPSPLKNPLVQDSYEPGSTFKVIAAAAALDENLVREDETFFCENGAFALSPGVVIRDHEPKADLTLAQILEHSSNIGIAKLAERIGALRFYRASRAFGFGSKTGIALPGETGGELKPLSDLTRVGLAAASYGYGIGASPLQVVSAYSAIANGGVLWEPRIVLDGKGPVKVRRVASAAAMARLSAMLEGVVESGTGVSARIPGYRIAGKTGTSRRLDPATRRYSTNAYNASFVGFLPASKPQWTILVVIEEPTGAYYGSQVAAPVFGKLARRLLTLHGLPPDQAVRVARRDPH